MNNNSGKKGRSKISRLGIIIFKIIRFLIFNLILVAGAITGGFLGALKAIDTHYSTPALNEMVDAGYFVCGQDDLFEDLDFILDNCETRSYSGIEKLFREQFENNTTLTDSGSALISTINQIDLPSLPQVAELPDYQGLLDIITEAQELEPLNIWNIREYGEIALEFIEYFSENGKELLSFLSSDIFSEVEDFVDSAKQAYLALEQGLGYLNVLSSVKIPTKQIGWSALAGMGIGMLVLGLAAWGIYKLIEFGIKLTKKAVGKKIREKQALEYEQSEIQDLANRDAEFEEMIKK